MPRRLRVASGGYAWARTLLIDKYGDVGGTHTIGGVPKYWFGRRTEFVLQLDREAGSMMELVVLSNFDIKGIACSDHVFSGFVEWEYSRNHPATIPYRALVPRDLEGILVIGKAYSCTHDALSLARMQRDLMAIEAVDDPRLSLSQWKRTGVARRVTESDPVRSARP